jgi:DNA-binding MarR family transcriptional regulator
MDAMAADDHDATALAIAEGVWALHEALRGELAAILAELDLTRSLADALWALDPVEGPRPRRVLAQRLRCDPSNVTFLADRLEERGLVQRVADPADRRVKALALTGAGAAARTRLVDALAGGGALERLTAAQRRTLAGLLTRATIR